MLTHIFLINQLSADSGVSILPPAMNDMYQGTFLPSVPATQSRLPVGFVTKLSGCAEALCQLMIGLGGEFLQGHACLFLSWHLLDTAKWSGESNLPLDDAFTIGFNGVDLPKNSDSHSIVKSVNLGRRTPSLEESGESVEKKEFVTVPDALPLRN